MSWPETVPVSRREAADGMENDVQSATAVDGVQQRAAELLDEAERLLEIGRVEEAREKLQECIRLHPDSPPALNKLGVCYARLEQWENARAQFVAALAIDPTYAPAHSNMGNLHREAGRLDDAVTSYMEALRHDPDYHIAHHNLGVVYKQQGKISEAVSHLKRANRLEKAYIREEARTRRGGKPAYNMWFWVAAIALLAYLLLR